MDNLDMKMDDEDLIKLSIQKWQDIVDGTGTDEGITNCALCQKYYYSGCHCDDCPIKKITGQRFCGGTPYVQWARRHSHDAAQAMLEWLKTNVAPMCQHACE